MGEFMNNKLVKLFLIFLISSFISCQVVQGPVIAGDESDSIMGNNNPNHDKGYHDSVVNSDDSTFLQNNINEGRDTSSDLILKEMKSVENNEGDLCIVSILGDFQRLDGVDSIIDLKMRSDFAIDTWGNADAAVRELNGEKIFEVDFNGIGGAYIKIKNGIGLSNFENGVLVFEMKSIDNPNMLLKIETTQNEFNEYPISNFESYTGAWQKVEIQLSEFSSVNFRRITVPFGIHLGEGYVYFKNIYYQKKLANSSNTNIIASNLQNEEGFKSSSSSANNEIIDEALVNEEVTIGPMKLIWSDEFNDDGLNLENWNIEQMRSFNDQEMQYYTSGHDESGSNIWVSDGHLTIEARKEKVKMYDFTSGQITSQKKIEMKKGRIEARIKLAAGKGIRSAFILLGSDISEQGWPNCGEIDVVESKGRLIDRFSGSIHRGTSWILDNYYSENFMDSEADFTEEFHDYAVEIKEGEITWEIDGQPFMSVQDEGRQEIYWPFEKEKFMVFKVTVGGWFDELRLPNDEELPAKMQVDWVRVYQ
jgi:hypothetical protein